MWKESWVWKSWKFSMGSILDRLQILPNRIPIKKRKKEKKGIKTPELKQVFLKEHNQIVFSGQSLPSILFVMWQISLKNYLAKKKNWVRKATRIIWPVKYWKLFSGENCTTLKCMWYLKLELHVKIFNAN